MDYHLYGTRRCSIAGISADYNGALLLSRIVNCLLASTESVFALVQRPYYGSVPLSQSSIANLSDEIENLKVADDFFSISYHYSVRKKNDAFVNAFVQIWREYEQPGFFFFTEDLGSDLYNSILENKKFSVIEKDRRIFDLAPCYMTFKSVEEDVLWIDKHEELDFDSVITCSGSKL